MLKNAVLFPIGRLLSRATSIKAVSALMSAATLALPLAANAQGPLPTTQLTAGIHIIHAEVADTESRRRNGLMFREQLAGNDGMLFVFERPDRQCFWMRNTLLPLSIAFIADDGTIIGIEDMSPQSDDTHCARKPVRYALEMAQGWYKEHGIGSGKKIDGLP